MTTDDLITLYEKKKKKFGNEAYKYISDIFAEAKDIHAKNAIARGVRDTDQSWRSFKGHNLEKLIEYIIVDGVRSLGLEIINGNKIEKRTKNDIVFSTLKRNLCIDYGEYGMHLPDVDMVIYEPETCKVIAVLSSKVTLRERVTETGYWKFKLNEQAYTRHIKVFFITLDEDGTLTTKIPAKKGRAVCEVDTDGCYVLTNENIETSNKVKMFSEFLNDLSKLRKGKNEN